MNKIETLKAQKNIYNQLKKLNLKDTKNNEQKTKHETIPKTKRNTKTESQSETIPKTKIESQSETKSQKNTKKEDETKPKKSLNNYQLFVKSEIIKPEYSELPQTKKIEKIAKLWNEKKNEI